MCLTSFVVRKMQTPATRYHVTPTWVRRQSWVGEEWSGGPPAFGWECKTAGATLESPLAFPQNLIVQSSSHPAVPLPGADPRGPEMDVHSENVWANVCSSFLPPNCRRPKYPATNEWIKMWYMHAMGYYSAKRGT